MARGLGKIARAYGTAAIAALLTAGTPSVSAAEGGLRCGLMVGGLPIAAQQSDTFQRSSTHGSTSNGLAATYLPGPQVAKLNIRTRVLPQATPLLNERVWYKRSRLPAAITVANFGCTWI